MCLPQAYTISTPFAECKNRECRCRPIGNRVTVAHDDGSEPKQKERRGAEPVWVNVRFTVMPHATTRRAYNTSVFHERFSVCYRVRSYAPVRQPPYRKGAFSPVGVTTSTSSGASYIAIPPVEIIGVPGRRPKQHGEVLHKTAIRARRPLRSFQMPSCGRMGSPSGHPTCARFRPGVTRASTG